MKLLRMLHFPFNVTPLLMRSALYATVVPGRSQMERLKLIWKDLGLRATVRECFAMARNLMIRGSIYRYGCIGRARVTNAGMNYLRDTIVTNSAYTAYSVFNYHGSGTGVAAENVADTTLGTEVGSRATGTQSHPSKGVAQTLGQCSYSGSYAITEHGVFSQSSGGTLWDRTVFTAKNVVSGDKIQFTYQLTFGSGG